MREVRDERSLGDLFAELSREVSTLVRQEVHLAKAEVSQKASQVGRNVAFVALGGFIAYAGFLALIAALILGLSEFMAGWLAALLVGLIICAVGYLLLQTGINELKRVNPVPRRTVESLKEDAEWVKQQMS
jgi:xanthine/uracil permease